ncbi:MAG TPA: hypothetical protein VGD24_07685 [Gallionella sp.]
MGDKFSDRLLGFECDIPDGWAVMPGVWARKAKLAAAGTSEELEEVLKASTNIPFLSLHRMQNDPDESIPMLQFTAKPLPILYQLGGPDGVIDDVLGHLKNAFPDFRLLQRLSPYLIAGAAGTYIKASMSAVNEHGDRFSCVSEVILLMAPRYCLIAGFSGPADTEKRPAGDFDAIMRSIRMA